MGGKLTVDQDEVLRLHSQGLMTKTICEILGVHRASVQRLLHSHGLKSNDKRRQCRENPDLAHFMTRKIIKTRATCKARGIPFGLDKQYLIDRFTAQQGRCFYTDIPMQLYAVLSERDVSMSFDKVDPDGGYVAGNVVLCTTRTNTIKHNVTLDEMAVWMPDWYERAVRFLSTWKRQMESN